MGFFTVFSVTFLQKKCGKCWISEKKGKFKSMPRISCCQALLNNLENQLASNILLMIILDSDHPDSQIDLDTEFWELLEEYDAINSSRYLLQRNQHIPQQVAYRAIIRDLPLERQRQIIRMDWLSFERLEGLIKDHPVFQNNSRNPQQEVWIQLVTALERLGFNGNGSSVGREASFLGLSAGSVVTYTRRVIKAIRSLESEYLAWPSSQTRRRFSTAMDEKYGLKGMVGVVDGTDIVLASAPNFQSEVYWTRTATR